MLPVPLPIAHRPIYEQALVVCVEGGRGARDKEGARVVVSLWVKCKGKGIQGGGAGSMR